MISGTRKRASKLRAKAVKALTKLKGSKLETVSQRVSLEQYAKTLAHFEQGDQTSLVSLVQGLSSQILDDSEFTANVEAPRFIPQETQAQIKCCVGCASCCHEPLQVSILDAIGVAKFLLASGQSEQWLQKVKSYTETLEPYKNERHRLKENFEPCPFLGEDKGCQVYLARPVICRAFHSTDVSVCRSILDNKSQVRSVPMFTGLFGFKGLNLSGARKALQELGFDDRPVILAKAVEILLQDFEAVLEEWLDGEAVFEAAVVVN